MWADSIVSFTPTVLRYAPGRPASILVSNDMRHLSTELRWTGFPPELYI